ncbi:hypothetical protein [Deinococcus sonorensis]|uniref:Secreted protein n=2 Tax=Deinococcus sonorensis TaxID=309891 RepID=A0AAU7UEY6_9DEIO
MVLAVFLNHAMAGPRAPLYVALVHSGQAIVLEHGLRDGQLRIHGDREIEAGECGRRVPNSGEIRTGGPPGDRSQHIC